MQRKQVNVLFTSAGRRVELFRAFKNAYESLELLGRIIALDIDVLAPALQVADRSYIVPRLNAIEFVPTLTAICARERVDLIFPLIDPDIFILSQNRRVIESTGAKLAVVPLNAARITDDKWLTYDFFRRLNLSTPASWLPHSIERERLDYPLFIKPRHGSAGKNTFRVENPVELKFFSDYVPDPIVQEFVAGPEITTDVTCDTAGDLLGVVSRKRIEVRWGEVAKGVTIYEQAIVEGCIRIAKTLPAIGPITVQCILKAGVPHFTEINARFGGGVPLGIAAGVESPKWLLARAAGIPIDIPPVGSYRTGFYLTRCDDSFFLTESQHAEMASHHL